MTRKKRMKLKDYALPMTGLVAFLVILMQFTGLFSITGVSGGGANSLGLAIYTSTWCAPCDTGEQLETYKFNGQGTAYKLFTCDQGYTPKGCNFEVEPEGGLGESALYVCPIGFDESKVRTALEQEFKTFSSGTEFSECDKYSEQNKKLTTDVQTDINVPEGSYLFLGSEVGINLQKTYENYCLRTLQLGQLTSRDGCSKSLLAQNVADYPDFPGNEVPFTKNAIENVVIGYSQFVGVVNEVNGKYLRFGNAGNIESCGIKTDNNGQRYVDLITCASAPQYDCVPSLPPTGYICTQGKLVKVAENGECSGSGVIGNKIVGDKTCELVCTDGKQSTRSCVDIIGFDEGKVPPQTLPEGTPLPIGLFVLAGAILLGAGIIFMATRKKGEMGL